MSPDQPRLRKVQAQADLSSPDIKALSKEVSYDELSQHNTKESCWVVIYDKVWDVTDFLNTHPGGAQIILKHAGSDLTLLYDGAHDKTLVERTLPPDCLIGKCDQEMAVKIANRPPSELDLNLDIRLPYPPLNAILNVQDFEQAANSYLSPEALAYYSSGAEDEVSLREAQSIFSRITFRPRVLRDVSRIDTTRKMLGRPSSLPIYISPTGQSRYAHMKGDVCITRACGSEGILWCMPTTANHEEVFAWRVDPQQPLALQLYTGQDYDKTRALLRKAEALGVCAIFLTVDSPVIGRRERDDRAKVAKWGEDAMLSQGIAKAGSTHLLNPRLTWADLAWIREATSLPLVLKGIQTVEDAVEAYNHGVDGIVLSNHGGRSLDTAQSPLMVLLEIRRHAAHLVTDPEIRKKFEIFIDGGFRRGTDVIKALALGASAVGIGRPALYALTCSYGQQGVTRLINMLRNEIETSMALLGATNLDELVPQMVNVERLEGEVQPKSKM
ncbi:cytochrome b2 [Magnaporthiopsis poae ATCC 64411]|uniref:Cytochrome b2 n=1 Tax=Magnaporthiopsis poae (strain ATCC 64411 / 73-15) TaxID=644358 RepID=A0A0C4E9B3_MAGP6|nr:cytochrome b2 [Magnaporthiopsis poae ATCC 64411]